MGNLIHTLKKRQQTRASYQKSLIQESGLFLHDWYLQQCAQAQLPDTVHFQNAIDHYLDIGESSNLSPNPYFDPEWYRSRVPAARKNGQSALAHYATKGWRNGKHPSRMFSIRLYFEAYPELVEQQTEPLAYHLSRGKNEGKAAFHLSLQADGKSAEISATKDIAGSGLFVADWYTSYYSDLWSIETDALQHFIRFGSAEGRNPNPYFETHWYAKVHNLLTEDGEKFSSEILQLYHRLPILHYIREGGKKGLATSPLFDSRAYVEQETEALVAATPLSHLIEDLKRNGYKKLPRYEGQTSTKLQKEAKLPAPDHIRSAMAYSPKYLTPVNNTFDPHAMDIHWVIPDFAAGAGGHMTIFRMVHFLEVMGHKQTIWINNPDQHKTEDSAYQDIIRHFQHFGGQVKFMTTAFADEAQGDAIIATDCWSAYPVMSAPNFHRRFYFVQDHEPSFHAMGTEHILAEQTYNFDMDCICASPWLAEMMQGKYGRKASYFWLAADKKLYWPAKTKKANTLPRIAVYARHFTARRAVELAMLALEQLAARGAKFHVDFFGADLNLKAAPFPLTDHGVASPEELAKLFRAADIGLVFSATNYSLVPQEMMASGLPIVELAGESTRSIFPEDVVTLAEPHPMKIAAALETLLTDTAKRDTQAEAALDWVNQFSWPASAKTVEGALLCGLDSVAERAVSKTGLKGLVHSGTETPIRASVVIPTFNAGAGFATVLEAVTNQEAPWAFEVLVIDSGSTDGTLDIVARHPDVRLHEIESKDFNHGATRNLGAELTRGEFIAFLTHDALPYNSRWLYNMVCGLEHYPEAAGAFGKHFAYDHATDYTKKELNAHFAMFDSLELLMDKNTDRKRWNDGDIQWRQLLHFYSDNNSCFRRVVWEKIPYQRVVFGEDQLWANDIIEAGHAKLYVPKAIVYHSHDYDAAETFERAKTESAFFKHFFGYCLMKDAKTVEKTCRDFDKDDVRFAEVNDVPAEILEERRKLLRARFEGFLAGWQADTSTLF